MPEEAGRGSRIKEKRRQPESRRPISEIIRKRAQVLVPLSARCLVFVHQLLGDIMRRFLIPFQLDGV